MLYALPWLDRRFISKDYRRHDLLERPRDNPRRTALAAAVLGAVAVVFAAGSADRLFFQFGFGYEGAIWFFRGAFLLVPVLVFALTKRICVQLGREGCASAAGLERHARAAKLPRWVRHRTRWRPSRHGGEPGELNVASLAQECLVKVLAQLGDRLIDRARTGILELFL